MSRVASVTKSIIADKLGLDENEVVLQGNFINDLGATWVDVADIILALEAAFKITIPIIVSGDEVKGFKRIEEVIDYIKKYVEEF